MGSVWRAERADGSYQREVALKLPRLTWGEGLARLMAQERDIGAMLEHPNIARLYDAGIDTRGWPYLALELVAGLPIDAQAVLLVELDGIEAGLDEEAEKVETILRRHGARSVRLASDEKERKKLWAARKGSFGAVGRLSPDIMIQDAVVPRSRLPEVLAETYRISAEYKIKLANVFHAGDGNLHPLICFDLRKGDDLERVRHAGREGLVEGASGMTQRGQGQRECLEGLRLGRIGREDLGDAEPLLEVPRGAAQLLRRRHDDHRRAGGTRDAPQFGEQGEAVEARQRQVRHHQLGQLAAPQHRLRLVAVPGDDGFVASQLDQIADHPGPAGVGIRNQDVRRPGRDSDAGWWLVGYGGRH
jgi:hypothetical protein